MDFVRITGKPKQSVASIIFCHLKSEKNLADDNFKGQIHPDGCGNTYSPWRLLGATDRRNKHRGGQFIPEDLPGRQTLYIGQFIRLLYEADSLPLVN